MESVDYCAIGADWGAIMNVKTNIRAGKGSDGASGRDPNKKPRSSDDAPEVEVEVYVPPVSRCAGL